MGLSEWWNKKVVEAGGILKGEQRFVNAHELLFVQNWLREAVVEVGTTLTAVEGGWRHRKSETVKVIASNDHDLVYDIPIGTFKKLGRERRNSGRTESVMEERASNTAKVILVKGILDEFRSRIIALAVIDQTARTPFRRTDDLITMQVLAVASISNLQKENISRIQIEAVDRTIERQKSRISKWL